jgi:hypothetical protein
MKITYVVGVIAVIVISAKAQEGCDGPVTVPGIAPGYCTCVSTANGGPGGSVGSGYCQPVGSTTTQSDYSICGGSGYTYCTCLNETVGYSGLTCTDTTSIAALGGAEQGYEDCMLDQQYHNNYNCPFSWCVWNTCTMPTSGGTPIVKCVVNDLGDYTGCAIAQLRKPASPSVVKLALRNHGN